MMRIVDMYKGIVYFSINLAKGKIEVVDRNSNNDWIKVEIVVIIHISLDNNSWS